jgi:SH3 domain-containing protein
MVIVRPMSSRKADGPLAVQVPSPGSDRPSWIGVGAIAAAGFLIGVVWPRLAGVRPGPSVPEAVTASSGASEAPASSVATTVSAPVVLAAPARAPVASAAVPPSGGARVSVARGAVFACKTPSGDTLRSSECGSLPALDGVVLPRLRKLGDCPEAAATSGKLRLVVRADFTRGSIGVDLARDHGVAAAEPLLTCAKAALNSATLEGIAHENARYSVSYTVTFATPSAPAPAAMPASAPEANPPPVARAAPEIADGTAQVEWEVAIVRDTPKTGKVVARLPRGTPLRVGTARDGWYPAKYGDGFASDGWVYRGAIGR